MAEVPQRGRRDRQIVLFSYAKRTVLAVANLVMLTSTTAWGEETFEALSSLAQSAEEAVKTLTDAQQACGCADNEAAKEECLAKGKNALASIRDGKVLALYRFGGDSEVVKWGEYDGKRGGLPIELVGFGAFQETNLCWPQFCYENDASDEQDSVEFQASGKAAWKGLLPLDPDTAKVLAADPKSFRFELIVAVGTPKKKARSIPHAGRVKSTLLADLERQVAPIRNRFSADERDTYLRLRRCLERYPTQRFEVSSPARVRAIRVYTLSGSSPDYFLSQPASAVPLAELRREYWESKSEELRQLQQKCSQQVTATDRLGQMKESSAKHKACKQWSSAVLLWPNRQASPEDVEEARTFLRRACNGDRTAIEEACSLMNAEGDAGPPK